MNIGRKFNSEIELTKHIRDNVDVYMNLLREQTGSLEEKYLKSHKQGLIGVCCVTASIITWFIHPPIFIPLSLLLLYFGINKIRVALPGVYTFNKSLNRALYTLVFAFFDLQATYLEQSEEVKPKTLDLLPNRLEFIKYAFPKKYYSDSLFPAATERVEKMLYDSELINEPRNSLMVDDMFTIKVTDRELFVTELDVKDIQKGGRSTFIKPVFHGLFISLELPRILEGKTFISTEVDLLYQDLIDHEFDPGALATEMEWNDFEKLLQIKTTDPFEARYILTPDFMVELYNWWQDKKKLGDKKLQVRMSFTGNHMYLLFPSNKVKVGSTLMRVQAGKLSGYIESVALPLMHVLNVADEVEKRFV